MCDTAGSDPLDPITWNNDCAMGSCKNCPELVVDTPMTDLLRKIDVLVWKKGVSGKLDKSGKEKEVFSLFKEEIEIAEAVTNLKTDGKDLKKHIFVAYNQW